MKLLIISIFVLTLSFYSNAQNLKILKPIIGNKISYSQKEQEEWIKTIDLYDKMNKSPISYDSLSDRDKILIDKIEMGDGPVTIYGDNWYNGGGPYKITSSSNLISTNTGNYKVDNIQDFNLLTAWGTRNSNNAIGEYVEFYFIPFSPRVNKIIIYNGYFKNQSLWESNSRVRQFKLYINKKPYAILNLADMNVSQSFSIDPIQSNIKDSDMVLKFEILNVYKGSKYSDVLISEINFDGLDVLCLSKGTKISQPKGKAIRIEDILIGDTVITYNEKEDKISSVIVNKREKVNHTNLINYIFQNGDSIISTQDHPFLINDKGWCSLHPDKSSIYQGFEHIKKIEIGDSFNMIAQDGGHTLNKLIKIEYLKGIQETYTISKLSLGNNFIANGFIVGIEDLKCDK